MKELKAVSYGEILWDVFPDQKSLGGAPLNIALRLTTLGVKTRIISRLGTDALAEETREILDKTDLILTNIQEDDTLETGQVIVTLDEKGSASYEISQPVAWDAIEITEANQEAVGKADIFIFGSLVARNEGSRTTLKELLPQSHFAVFDINLRAPHYNLDTVVHFMKQAQFIKMNDEELEKIIEHLHITARNMEDQIKQICDLTGAGTLCITCGENGAVLYINGKLHTHPGFSTKLVDTVGAGDSFLAGLLAQLYKEEATPDKALEFACALGAMVAGKKGANAKIAVQEIHEKIASER